VWEHISEYIDGSIDAKLREDIERALRTLRNLLSNPGFDEEYSDLDRG